MVDWLPNKVKIEIESLHVCMHECMYISVYVCIMHACMYA